ncbi:uncharacterized protein N7477_001858 [Penicillium maclennaniae]|uniref:uncharacterized protein n=1 Tax=Penicillium maclennaniae TaxID=1343394 RepID=UPI002540B590|nr:uncharacterized protein N7477_001858 [Penicillium maclennaniae]KAJ5681918.1 hypothetical protein N7477_001858 [Penicillium maclennaniae]
MKTFITLAAFAAGTNALVGRGDSCCFHLTASGDASGSVGQLSDGQNRIGDNSLSSADYCINSSGGVTDSHGRGSPTTQWQCDEGASPTTGFSIASNGALEYHGSNSFIACETGQNGGRNIYTTNSTSVTQCKSIKLTADSCSGSGAGASGSSSSTIPSARSSSAVGSSAVSPSAMSSATPSPSPAYSSSAASAPAYSSSAASAPAYSTSAASAPAYSSSAASAPAGSAPAGSALGGSAPGASSAHPSGPASPAGCLTGSPVTTTVTVTASDCACATSAPAAGGVGAAGSGSAPSSAPAGGAGGSPAPTSSVPAAGTGGSGSGSSSIAPSAPASNVRPSVPAGVQFSSSAAPAPSASAGGMQSSSNAARPSTMSSVAATSASSAPSLTSSAGGHCPTTLTSGNYQYPHLIIPIDSSAPTTAAGTSYNGTVSSTISTIFNFDIPAYYSDKTCSLVFLFPKKADLETSSYSFSGDGKIDISKLSSVATESTDYSNAPSVAQDLGSLTISPGNSYVLTTFACPAGDAIAYEMKNAGSTNLNFFEDWNPSPLGLFITSC